MLPTNVGYENFENPCSQQTLDTKILKIRAPNKCGGGKQLKMVFVSIKICI